MVKIKLFGIVLLIILITLLNGCGSPGGGPTPTPTPIPHVVYTVGYISKNLMYNYTDRIPCYWTGSIPFTLLLLTGSTYGEACSVFVSGSTIYTVGSYGNNPCYWMGPTLTFLPLLEGTTTGKAQSIFVDGSTLYIGGSSLLLDWNSPHGPPDTHFSVQWASVFNLC